MATLEAIVDGKEPVQEELVVEEPKVEVEAVEETAEPEETEVEETAEETPEEPGEEEATTPVAAKEVPLTALLDERDKRKEARAEAERLQMELEEAKKQPLDFYEDPEGAIATKINEAVAPLQEQFTRQYIDLSRQMTKEFVGVDKYEPAEQAFADAAKQNPLLVQNALESGNPGKYMYDTGTQMLQLDSAGGDVNAMREQIRAEEKAKLLKEMKSKEDKLSNVPESLTETPSASAPGEKVEGGPTPLGNFLPSN